MGSMVFCVCYAFALNVSLCCNVLLYDNNPGITDECMRRVDVTISSDKVQKRGVRKMPY